MYDMRPGPQGGRHLGVEAVKDLQIASRLPVVLPVGLVTKDCSHCSHKDLWVDVCKMDEYMHAFTLLFRKVNSYSVRLHDTIVLPQFESKKIRLFHSCRFV